ncbi:hypothetical protein GALMADRAFT_42720, partial [Galerina marginata CBS 339.88]
FPLPPHLRKKAGTLAIVPTICEFERNWNLFTHNILSNMSWNNVVAAGGSVLATFLIHNIYLQSSQLSAALFPTRHVQIILRLYHSPAEVLAGFDIDSCCFAYDGSHLWTCPRALASCIRQSNSVDLTRRSPSYEVRLAKYGQRGHEVYLPSLSRNKIDPSIFCHPSPKRPSGLARLLILERL